MPGTSPGIYMATPRTARVLIDVID